MSSPTPADNPAAGSSDLQDIAEIPVSPIVRENPPGSPQDGAIKPPASKESQKLADQGERPRSTSQPEARLRPQSPQRAHSHQREPNNNDSESNYSCKSPGRHSQNRPREEWEDDRWTPLPYDYSRDHDRFWRDDARLRNSTSRRGPGSRPPPPAMYNHHPPGFAYDDDLDDKARAQAREGGHHASKGSVDILLSRKRRPTDEEKGHVPTIPLRSVLSGHTFADGSAGRRVEWGALTPEEKAEVMRIPWTHWMDSDLKNHFVAWLGEFIGTTMFLFFAFAGAEVANIRSAADKANTRPGEEVILNLDVLIYVSLSFGFSLMVNVWVFFRISGGLFNPAVTLGMLLVKAITPIRAAFLFVAQIIGSLLASVVVRYLFPGSFNVRTTLGGGASLTQGFFIEALLTAELVFTIFMLAKEKHRATFIAPVGIGLALFIAELAGVQFTGGSLNPARSFGPCVIAGKFERSHWIYWIGPCTGALIAVIFYRCIKTLEYEMANPGADGDDENDPTKNPEKRAEIQSTKAPSIVVV